MFVMTAVVLGAIRLCVGGEFRRDLFHLSRIDRSVTVAIEPGESLFGSRRKFVGRYLSVLIGIHAHHVFHDTLWVHAAAALGVAVRAMAAMSVRVTSLVLAMPAVALMVRLLAIAVMFVMCMLVAAAVLVMCLLAITRAFVRCF